MLIQLVLVLVIDQLCLASAQPQKVKGLNIPLQNAQSFQRADDAVIKDCVDSEPDVILIDRTNYNQEVNLNRLNSYSWQLNLNENGISYLNETRISNLDDIISGYFFAKIFHFPEELSGARLEKHCFELARILQRLYSLSGKYHLEKLRETSKIPRDIFACTATCGRDKEVCFEMIKVGNHF